jgi:Arc/MetJ-type ribon-helix-helix transcriptional regulator
VARAHISLPDELLRQIDRLAGRRRRSRFVEDAVREKLTREEQAVALAASAGILRTEEYPQWSAPGGASDWVARLREEDDAGSPRAPGVEP